MSINQSINQSISQQANEDWQTTYWATCFDWPDSSLFPERPVISATDMCPPPALESMIDSDVVTECPRPVVPAVVVGLDWAGLLALAVEEVVFAFAVWPSRSSLPDFAFAEGLLLASPVFVTVAVGLDWAALLALAVEEVVFAFAASSSLLSLPDAAFAGDLLLAGSVFFAFIRWNKNRNTICMWIPWVACKVVTFYCKI